MKEEHKAALITVLSVCLGSGIDKHDTYLITTIKQLPRVIVPPDLAFGRCSYLGLFVRGHPEEGQEDRPVDGALSVDHRRGGGRGGQVEAARSVVQVRVEAPLQGLVEHHLAEETGGETSFICFLAARGGDVWTRLPT